MYGKYDIFFRQYAASWGQIWLRKQWGEFKKWYEENNASFREAQGVPYNVSAWGDTSWLKYHIRYCIEKNKYFVYPYQSLSTNFTDIGSHNNYVTTLYQVPMQMDYNKQYLFAKISEVAAVYDAFFENQKLSEYLKVSEQGLCVDLYGVKKNVEQKKPHELNIIMNVEGTEIRLYDTENKQKKFRQGLSLYKKYDYYFRFSHCPWKEQVKLLFHKVLLKLGGDRG